MRIGVLGPLGPEPPMALAASGDKTLKALKETAARALHFVHASGNVTTSALGTEAQLKSDPEYLES